MPTTLPLKPKKGNHKLQFLKSEVTYHKRLQNIVNKINSAEKLDEILIDLKDEMVTLFEAERITIYAVDGKRRELISRFKTGDEISEIRLPISASSIAGYSALKQQLLNIKSVADKNELARINPDLIFDDRWDKKTGFITKQMLVCPIIYQRYLLGIIQLMNRRNGVAFGNIEEKSIRELTHILAIAFYNQRRLAAVKKTKFDYLLENNLLTRKELNNAIADSRRRKESIEQVLLTQLKIPKGEIGKSLSRFYGVPFRQFSEKIPIPSDLLVGLKVPFMRTNIWVPLNTEDGKIVIAVDNPNNLQKIDLIRSLFKNTELKLCVALKNDILDFIKLFYEDQKESAGIDEILSQLEDEAEDFDEAESFVGEADSTVVKLVNKIILDAVARNASDIHIEPYPGKQNTQVRLRVDGNCYLYQTIPYHFKNAVISRIKIISDLDITERRKPQDGKIRIKRHSGNNIELRVATIPTQGGLEDAVLRILYAGEPKPLHEMYFSARNHKIFLEAITQPYGIILLCGPTGSGKTTTLHSALAHINKPETKIWTAEDPVEITQAGLRQLQVKPKIGLDFSTAMRSFLRADPDVIMVGEMRDEETAQIAIQASLTGHLVLSTLHTNSAPESIVRLLEMGMDSFNFADAVLCIMAQRLVLTLCPQCKQEYHPLKKEYDELVREYGVNDFNENVNIPYTSDLALYKPEGCEYCSYSGYRDRMALHELLMGTEEIQQKIRNRSSVEEIRAQALKDGMTTLRQDGIEKIFSGNCDLLQVRKVTIK